MSRLFPYMKQSSDYCFEITNAVLHRMKQNGEKNQAEMLCCPLFVRFWVIRLFMCAGTPRQWNNDMSLQVVCRIFLGFWIGLREVSKGVSLVWGRFKGLQDHFSGGTLVPRLHLKPFCKKNTHGSCHIQRTSAWLTFKLCLAQSENMSLTGHLTIQLALTIVV